MEITRWLKSLAPHHMRQQVRRGFLGNVCPLPSPGGAAKALEEVRKDLEGQSNASPELETGGTWRRLGLWTWPVGPQG